MHKQIIAELKKVANKDRAEKSKSFFKTGKGEYGEGDIFIGVKVPDQRKIAKKYQKEITLKDIEQLLHSDIHEHRLTGLFLLVGMYKSAKGDTQKREAIITFYLSNTENVNNWDLVDSSAHYILGDYLLDKTKEQRKILYTLAQANNLWKQRIAIMSTLAFINNNDFDDTLAISRLLLTHEHDLIHKAVGWMLREVGKKNPETEERFLKKHYKQMPRTMLRYAIEKFNESKRQKYLHGEM